MKNRQIFLAVAFTGMLLANEPASADIVFLDNGPAAGNAAVNCNGTGLLVTGDEDAVVGRYGSTYGSLVSGKATQGPQLMSNYIRFFKDTFAKDGVSPGQAQKTMILSRCGLGGPKAP